MLNMRKVGSADKASETIHYLASRLVVKRGNTIQLADKRIRDKAERQAGRIWLFNYTVGGKKEAESRKLAFESIALYYLIFISPPEFKALFNKAVRHVSRRGSTSPRYHVALGVAVFIYSLDNKWSRPRVGQACRDLGLPLERKDVNKVAYIALLLNKLRLRAYVQYKSK